MNFIKTSFLSGLSTAISLIARLISTKIVAVLLGTNGMFLMGQLKDFLRLGNTISSFGIENGIIKYTSEFEKKEKDLSKIIGSSFKINFFSAIIFSFIVVVSKEYISEFLKINFNQNFYFLVLVLSIVSASIHTCFLSIYNGLKRINLYVLVNIFSNIAAAILLIILVTKMNIIGAFYALALNQIIALLINIIFFVYYRPFNISYLFDKLIKENFKKLSKFSLMAIAGPSCLIISTFIVRDYKFYLIPTFSKLEGNKLKNEIFKIWKITIPIIILITMAVYFLKDFIITILLSKDFILINSIIFFHLIGDIIKINCWVLGNILISKAKTKVFILFQIEWSFIFVILSIFLINYYGFVGVSIAYFITYIIHFSLLNLYFKNLIWK